MNFSDGLSDKKCRPKAAFYFLSEMVNLRRFFKRADDGGSVFQGEHHVVAVSGSVHMT